MENEISISFLICKLEVMIPIFMICCVASAKMYKGPNPVSGIQLMVVITIVILTQNLPLF